MLKQTYLLILVSTYICYARLIICVHNSPNSIVEMNVTIKLSKEWITTYSLSQKTTGQ